MNRILIIIGLVMAISTASFGAGYMVAKGRCDSKQLTALSNAVENDNEDSEVIAETRTGIENGKVKVVTKIVQLPPIIIESDCPLSDVVQLQQSIYEAIAEVQVH